MHPSRMLFIPQCYHHQLKSYKEILSDLATAYVINTVNVIRLEEDVATNVQLQLHFAKI